MITMCFLFLKKKIFNFSIKSLCKFYIIGELMLKCIVIDMLKKIK